MCDEDSEEWDPQPVKLREGETLDDMGHAARNIEQIRIAKEELEEDDLDE